MECCIFYTLFRFSAIRYYSDHNKFRMLLRLIASVEVLCKSAGVKDYRFVSQPAKRLDIKHSIALLIPGLLQIPGRML